MIILLMSGNQLQSVTTSSHFIDEVITMPKTTHSQYRKEKRRSGQCVRNDETLRLAAKGFKQREELGEEEVANYFQA